MSKNISKLFLASLLLMPMVAAAQGSAADPYGINDMVNAKLGTKNLRDTITSIINIVLGFLGILATLLILYGGFIWMTSQGNSEGIDKAKGIISAGVIGLVVIFVAYAISRFILGSLQNVA